MLYIAAPLDQQLGCVEVVVAYRSEQRCLALLVHSLDVCTELQQKAQNLCKLGVPGRVVQRLGEKGQKLELQNVGFLFLIHLAGNQPFCAYLIARFSVPVTRISSQVDEEVDCFLWVCVCDSLSQEILQNLLSFSIFKSEAVLQQPLRAPGGKQVYIAYLFIFLRCSCFNLNFTDLNRKYTERSSRETLEGPYRSQERLTSSVLPQLTTSTWTQQSVPRCSTLHVAHLPQHPVST